MKKTLRLLSLVCAFILTACGPSSPSSPSVSSPSVSDNPTGVLPTEDSSEPTETPSVSDNPTDLPTEVPTIDPTEEPTDEPTEIPTETQTEEPTVDPHKHTFGDEYLYDETHHWYPSTCGHPETETKEKHSFKKEVTNPTYEERGFTTYTCSICKYSYVADYTDVLEHNYSKTLSYNETHHWYACTDKGYENLKKDEKPHTFDEIVTPPTYESGGYTTYSCKYCEYSYRGNETNALEHNYSNKLSYDEHNHWYACTDKGYENLKKDEKPHTFDEIVTPPTYESGGYTTYSCKYCEYSYIGNYTDILKYKIIYHLDGGVNSPYNPTAFGPKDEFVLQPATKDGYGFLGWFDEDGNQIQIVTAGTNHDIEVTARWADVFTIENGRLVGFDESYPIVSVSIPSNVTTICKDVFADASYIYQIEIPKSVVHFEENAFEGCYSMVAVFYKGTVEDWNKIKFDGITSSPMLRADYFYALDSNNEPYEVTDLVFSDSVTEFNEYAFTNFSYLLSVKIPKNVTSIGPYLFFGCTSLETITFAKDSNLTTIEENAFYECESLKSIVLPEGTLTIGASAFEYCKSLEEIVLPSSITTIGRSAFNHCQSLKTVEIPSKVKVIEEHLFGDCTSLTSVKFNNSITAIKGYSFTGCVNLREVSIPNTCSSIGNYAFADCDKLYSVKIPSSVKTIESNAFEESSNVIIYAEASSKPSGWHYEWNTNYSPIYWNKKLSDIYTKNGVEYILDESTAIASCHLGVEQDVIIESSVSINGRNYSVTAVGAYAFQERYINSCIIPNTVKTLRENAFFVADLSWLVIPSSVVTLEDSALKGIYFATFYCEATSQPSSWPSDWNSGTCTIYWQNEWEYDSNHKPIAKK